MEEEEGKDEDEDEVEEEQEVENKEEEKGEQSVREINGDRNGCQITVAPS